MTRHTRKAPEINQNYPILHQLVKGNPHKFQLSQNRFFPQLCAPDFVEVVAVGAWKRSLCDSVVQYKRRRKKLNGRAVVVSTDCCWFVVVDHGQRPKDTKLSFARLGVSQRVGGGQPLGECVEWSTRCWMTTRRSTTYHYCVWSASTRQKNLGPCRTIQYCDGRRFFNRRRRPTHRT
jgi:hypothetical protein